MSIAEFKCLDMGRFDKMSLSEIQYYIEEGNKLLTKMTAYDPQVGEVMDALHRATEELRG